jgi:hypothetical protein
MTDREMLLAARDFTPTKEAISLHGLGFIQVKLPGRRMHVWHPDLPRRDCYAWSPIHNHRFSFRSTVLVGQQVNRRYNVIEGLQTDAGTHDRISHDGPRSEKGGRLSYVADGAIVSALPDEIYSPGQSYEMPVLQYHETPNSGIVVTVMEKLTEGTVHASTLIERGHTFHQDFDRFQFDEDRLWVFVSDALKHGARASQAGEAK